MDTQQASGNRRWNARPTILGNLDRFQGARERSLEVLLAVCGPERPGLDVAARIGDLESPPGNRLKALKGDLTGRHSIRVNDQYRITLRWEGGHAFEVAVEDYH